LYFTISSLIIARALDDTDIVSSLARIELNEGDEIVIDNNDHPGEGTSRGSQSFKPINAEISDEAFDISNIFGKMNVRPEPNLLDKDIPKIDLSKFHKVRT